MKNLKSFGKVLSKAEQKKVTGGFGLIAPYLCVNGQQCETTNDCCFGETCTFIQYGHPKYCY
ncbi:MAG: hypothetical protein ACFB10_11875 [Salibacteraceae bacterium]